MEDVILIVSLVVAVIVVAWSVYFHRETRRMFNKAGWRSASKGEKLTRKLRRRRSEKTEPLRPWRDEY